MTQVFLLIARIVALGLIFTVAPVVLGAYRRYRQRKTTVCPETGQIVEVELKAGRASLLSVFGEHRVRVKWCSLWPRKKGCSEQCVGNNWPSSPRDRNARAGNNKLS